MKIILSKEAIFDYEETIANELLNRRAFATTLRKYIKETEKSKQIVKMKYKNWRLVLFLKKTEEDWVVLGICEECDFKTEMLKDGTINCWLNSTLFDGEDYEYEIKPLKCPRCGATERQKKDGKDTRGAQKYKCCICHKWYTL